MCRANNVPMSFEGGCSRGRICDHGSRINLSNQITPCKATPCTLGDDCWGVISLLTHSGLLGGKDMREDVPLAPTDLYKSCQDPISGED